jgi:hypothetical protein
MCVMEEGLVARRMTNLKVTREETTKQQTRCDIVLKNITTA